MRKNLHSYEVLVMRLLDAMLPSGHDAAYHGIHSAHRIQRKEMGVNGAVVVFG